MCEWRLGRQKLAVGERDKAQEVAPTPITVEEIVACLKRLRLSLKRWTKQGGRQGYLNFLSDYIK